MVYETITVPFRGWTVVREIGQGSFGKVYEIRRDQYGIVERSAMKVISVPQDPDEIQAYLRKGDAPETLRKMYEGSRASVLREYQTMVRLKDCPNIVRCEDIRYRATGFNAIQIPALTSPVQSANVLRRSGFTATGYLGVCSG